MARPRPLALVDATPLQSEHRVRGVGTYTRHLCTALAELAPDEVRFAAEARGLDLLPDPVRQRATTGLRPHQPAQVYWLANEWFLRRALSRSRPLVFHATDFNGAVHPAGARLVATLYDLNWMKQPHAERDLSSRLANLRWHVYYRRRLPRADVIVAISESVRRDAITMLGVSPERVVTVPLGVDTTRFREGLPPGPFADTPPYFLFLGGPEPHKNLTRVLQAFAEVLARHPEAWLYVAGPWSEEAAEALRADCRRLGCAERLRVLGYVAAADLPALYARALALVFPSLEEGFGLPILEAMSCGTAVLTSDRGALQETAGDAALLVDPTDPAAIAAGLARLFDETGLRRHLREQGLLRAQGFSWRRLAARTLELYRACAAG